MVKQRMTSLDVRASVEEMRASLIGLRLTNLYDIDARIFLFRFGDSHTKRTVLVENGLRMHLTTLEREKPKMPAPFTMKLRKHIRAWRLQSIAQLQHDRTVDLCFGAAGTENCFHIIVELFSKGNVVLTDYAYNIMMLLRTHQDEDVTLMVRHPYPVVATPSLAASVVEQPAAVATGAEGGTDGSAVRARTGVLKADWDAILSRENDTETLKSILSAVKHFGPSFAEHILAKTATALQQQQQQQQQQPTKDGASAAAPNPNMKKAALVASSESMFTLLLPAMLEAWELSEAPLPSGGYLIVQAATAKGKRGAKTPAAAAAATSSSSPAGSEGAVHTAPDAAAGTHAITSSTRYDDFSPILLAQYATSAAGSAAEGVTTTFCESFGAVCDTFFLWTETEQLKRHNAKAAAATTGKVEKFKRDFQRRVTALEDAQEHNHHIGDLIVTNANAVNEALDLINGALAAGLQWDALQQLLRRRRAEGHAVACSIDALHLERNSITVLLYEDTAADNNDSDADDGGEEEEEEDGGSGHDAGEGSAPSGSRGEPVKVEVSLGKTAHANAVDYFNKKKASRTKLEKTLAAADKAEAGAQRKERHLAAKQETKKMILVVRERAWWEKLLWFITSAGDVALRGKDAQTTEILLRRHMRLGDILVHCDVDGALPCLLRPCTGLWHTHEAAGAGAAPDPRPQPCAVASLVETGVWCVSLTSAWEKKNAVGAWWVYASQLSGGTATGAYLFTGERHHLAPGPLALGCGLLFRVPRDMRGDAPAGADAPSAWPWRDLLSREAVVTGAGAVAADAAAELQELPSVEALRPRRERHAPAVDGAKPNAAAPAPAPAAAPAPHRKTTRRTGKNKGVCRSQLKEERAQRKRALAAAAAEASGIPSADSGRPEKRSAPAVGSPPPQQQQQLSKRQKLKMKKIQAKYGDQDEEDRMHGALLNGNELAQIQAAALAREAEEARAAAEEERALAKAARAKERASGRLRYIDAEANAPGDSDNKDDGSSSSSVELVDSFSDDENGENEDEEEKEEKEEEEEEEESTASDGVIDADTALSSTAPSTTADRMPARAAATTTRNARAFSTQSNAEMLAALVHYTSNPTTEDVVSHAVCVCAPLSALVDYRFRVELRVQPGAKKSQVAGRAVARFTDVLTGPSAASRKAKSKSGKPTDDVVPAPAVQNASVQTALEAIDTAEMVEQLRANADVVGRG